MKYAAFAIIGLLTLMASMADANAVVCARGVYRAGCAGAGGAAVVHRPAVAGCAVVNGRRVCGVR